MASLQVSGWTNGCVVAVLLVDAEAHEAVAKRFVNVAVRQQDVRERPLQHVAADDLEGVRVAGGI